MIAVGNVNKESYIFKKPTCSVSNYFTNTYYVPGPVLDSRDVEIKDYNLCLGGPLQWLGRQSCKWIISINCMTEVGTESLRAEERVSRRVVSHRSQCALSAKEIQ